MAIAEADLGVGQETFDTLNPATGIVVGTFPVHTPAAVEATVARARVAAQWWAGLGFDERRKRLLGVRAAIARRAMQAAELTHAENGKPHFDGLAEVLITCEHLTFAAKQAKRVLGPRRVRGGVLSAHHTAQVSYRPLGVVGLITPWNYPLLIPGSDIASALGAGNAVVLKPSEFTPAVARWLVERFTEVIPEQPVVQMVTGFGATGAALCSAGTDKIGFTGSAETGKKVMATCAETLTPVSLELGGKDALIVDEDADLDWAADSAAFGAFYNAGQTCISVEAAYVHERIYDVFLDKLVERLRNVRAESHPDAKLGPMCTTIQLAVVRRQLEDALERGARPVMGGLHSVRPPFVDPVVLVDVPEDALMMTQETFGPTLPVFKVRDADEAVRRINASPFGLGAAVFGKARAMEIARSLRSGACGVNTVMSFYYNAHLPFGGVRDSGFGSVHGPDGLRNFAHPSGIMRRRVTLGRFAPDRLDRDARMAPLIPGLARILYGRG